MKIFPLLFFIFIVNAGFGKSNPDTITNWQVYYGNQLITAGNEIQHRVPPTGKILVNNKIEKLRIHYLYDFIKPEWRIIIIKSGEEILFEGEQQLKDNHPMPIDLKEILDKKKSKQFKIQIYYSDNITQEKNRFISEIEIQSK